MAIDKWREFESLSDDEKAVRLWKENQERSDQKYIAGQALNEYMNEHEVSYNCHGKLESGNVTPDSLITLTKSGIDARAQDLVTAGVIPASAIGMPYDKFLEEHG